MAKLKSMGPIGTRHQAAIANMWRLNQWAQSLAEMGECPECFANQLQVACQELCESGTDAAEAAGYQTFGWPGGK